MQRKEVNWMETVEILEGQVNIFDEIDKLSKLTKEQLNTIEEIKQKDNVIEVKDPNHLGMCKALCEGYRENLIIPQGNREHAFYSCETKREYLIGADGNIISIKPLDLFSKPYVEEKKVVKNKKAKSR